MSKYAKVIVGLLVMVLCISISTECFFATEKSITKTKQFQSESTDPTYDDFDKTIIENGNEYELKNIDYKKIDTEKKTEKKDKTTVITKNGLSSKSYKVDSEASYYHDTVTVDGIDYSGTLVNVEYENHTKTNRKGEVSGTKNYGLRATKPTPPSTQSLSYYDSDTGQSYNVNAPLIRLETTDEKWQEYTYIDIVVSNYTDTQFMFNNKIVKHNGTTVLGKEYYNELLNMAGLTNGNYKVSSVSWTGNAYKSGNVKYRNARANIQAYSCAYTAYYYKSFGLEDIPVYTAKLTYKYSDEKVIKTVYTYEAVATYELIESNTTTIPETTSISTKDEVHITATTITTISLLLVISLGFVLLTMFLLTKVKSKNKIKINKKR